MLTSFADRYSFWKQVLTETLGAQETLLHVHVGLGIFVVSAVLFKKRMRSSVPVLIVFLFAVANEAIDLTASKTWVLPLSILDIVNTVFWPATIFLLARRGGSAIG